jgi:deazaflavin-dependent oxidoreductase (nitroreductase family)
VPLQYVDPTRPTNRVKRAMDRFSRSRFGQVAARLASKTDPWLGRISNGRVSWGMFNVPSATLKSTGAKTGQVRETQIAYFHDGPDVIVIASNYGGDKHPQWYYNLGAHPDCELGDEAFRAAEVTDPDEYARLYGLAEGYYGGFTDYRAKTTKTGRKIPVFRLTPRPISTGP